LTVLVVGNAFPESNVECPFPVTSRWVAAKHRLDLVHREERQERQVPSTSMSKVAFMFTFRSRSTN
jgi:hypothetical protein